MIDLPPISIQQTPQKRNIEAFIIG